MGDTCCKKKTIMQRFLCLRETKTVPESRFSILILFAVAFRLLIISVAVNPTEDLPMPAVPCSKMSLPFSRLSSNRVMSLMRSSTRVILNTKVRLQRLGVVSLEFLRMIGDRQDIEPNCLVSNCDPIGMIDPFNGTARHLKTWIKVYAII